MLLLLVSCNRHTVVPLSLFSTPSGKPLVAIEPMESLGRASVSEKIAEVLTNAIALRLEQKSRVIIGQKHPQFSVKMQLMQQEVLPAELAVNIHLEILDLRKDKPKVILQEVLSSTALFIGGDIETISWENPSFRTSPLGLAHRKISREIATRIEDYVWLAKGGSV